MAAKSAVNAFTSTFGTDAAGVLLEPPPSDELDPPPHAAAVANPSVATTTTPLRRSLISILLSRVPVRRDGKAGRIYPCCPKRQWACGGGLMRADLTQRSI